jgi:hypothetical protein
VGVSSPQIRQPFYVPFPSGGHLWPRECPAAATAFWRFASRLLVATSPGAKISVELPVQLRAIVEDRPFSLVRLLSLCPVASSRKSKPRCAEAVSRLFVEGFWIVTQRHLGSRSSSCHMRSSLSRIERLNPDAAYHPRSICNRKPSQSTSLKSAASLASAL